MEVFLYIGLFVISLAVLLRASDWFVDAAEEIGLSLGLSPLIIGITIVAFGTSLPELATATAAVLQGQSEIVISTVIGSNITNITLVLGLSAIVSRVITLEYNIWHIDMPYLWGSAFLLVFVILDLEVSRFEAVLLLLGIVVFLAYSIKGEASDQEVERVQAGWRAYLMLVVGGALVWLGARYTITAIEQLSQIAGVSSDIIALSAVALGTSLPEVIVSLSAARKGKASIAVGNVLGSNIFNTYVVVGIPALFGDLVIPEKILSFYLPLMLAMTLLFAIMSNNKKITRWEGFLLLIFFLYFYGELFKDV
jgi:cation:H+ antiporter